ncbi:MAG TPA: cob(I)yrinic acid a,c-diamide adenosyltransferase [Anaerolineales bacterium]|nr:cob(I)yrinic acid a,c-diamide adenosyltransferase [Anaerolineales bacterium]HUS84120.1 cob(I)yrinic acid a,c-diamide adenosyltransferase [Anaerolineales bacterium]
MPAYYSGEGDDGSTGLLGSERVPKYHLRPTAFGTVDEASAALGLSRATALSEETISVIHEVQKDLYAIMVELAAVPEEEERFHRLEASRLTWIEEQLDSFGARVNMPKEFILPGDSLPAAALDLARTVVRRAERQVVRLDHESKLSNPAILPYLNRLSSLCFVLSLWENEAAGVEQPSIAKSSE